jgi:hypothetical protein
MFISERISLRKCRRPTAIDAESWSQWMFPVREIKALEIT